MLLTRGMLVPLPYLSVLRVAGVYSELDPLKRPLVTAMGLSATKTLAESEFGLVQRGSYPFFSAAQTPLQKTSCTTTPHPIPA